jgi:hypothetical protein
MLTFPLLERYIPGNPPPIATARSVGFVPLARALALAAPVLDA